MWKGFLEINFYDYLNIKNVQGQIFGLFVKFLVWQCDVRFFSLVLFDLIYYSYEKFYFNILQKWIKYRRTLQWRFYLSVLMKDEKDIYWI